MWGHAYSLSRDLSRESLHEFVEFRFIGVVQHRYKALLEGLGRFLEYRMAARLEAQVEMTAIALMRGSLAARTAPKNEPKLVPVTPILRAPIAGRLQPVYDRETGIVHFCIETPIRRSPGRQPPHQPAVMSEKSASNL
jgi:hypothetical protein